ncbi:MAG: DUF4153 domain-containing protein [Nocardioidaceae bacterium]
MSTSAGGPRPAAPLARVASLKIKLGLLVAASVAVAAALGTVASDGGVAPWLAIPVTVALALGITQLLAVGMTAPLREMTAAARVMARGDYDVRVASGTRDEVGQLADAFNTMAADLATVDRERRDLVATVAHELRTPLTALSLRLENLVDGVEEPDPEALAELLAQSRRLSSLVGDLLDLSRIQAGLRPLDLAPVALAPLLEGVVAEVTRPGRVVRFAVEVAPGDLTVTADAVRLRQLLTNVLDNAARHSPSEGTVTVSATSSAGRWLLEVSDEGPGVPPESRERVFERFGTLAGHEGGGTGLGLAIARWVAELHGGTVRFVDPAAGSAGARLRLELPLTPPVHPTSEETTMSPTPVPPAAAAPPSAPPSAQPAPAASPPPAGATPPPPLDALFGAFWPERALPRRVDVLLAALGTGALAGVVLPEHEPGLALLLVLAAAGATVLFAARHRRDPFTLASAAICAVLASTVVLRDAQWIVLLCLLAGAGLMTVAVTRGATVPGFVLSGISWVLAGLRGLPWLGRTAGRLAGVGRGPAVVRTVALSVAGLLVFGLLFASADAVFAHWLDLVLPDWTVDSFVARTFVAVFVGGVVLAAAYLALNPPVVDHGAGERRPVRQRYEWLAPVLVVAAVFAAFLGAQLAEVFGGDAYVQRTTGLTYSEYAHHGFWQLVVATVLTLLVVWAAGRKAAVETAVDRRWLRGALGALCLLTLVVVWSAMHRMQVYDQAYGFTRTRLLVWVFEGWLGLVLLGVLGAGLRLRAGWLARFGLLTGTAALAGLALLNPDAWIAQHNLDRYQETGKVDTAYLSTLSADAVPVMAGQTDVVELTCALPQSWYVRDRSWLSWNLGRARALDAVGGLSGWDARFAGCLSD